MIESRKLRGIGAIAALFLLASPFASAATVSGELAFVGTYTPTGGAGADLSDATGISFDNPVSIDAATGDVVGLAGGVSSWAPFTFAPFAGPVDPFLIAAGGQVQFELLDLLIDLQTATALNLSGSGILTVPGFDPTVADITLTADALGGVFTFSATIASAVVPLPAAVWMFTFALGVLGLTRRRKG